MTPEFRLSYIDAQIFSKYPKSQRLGIRTTLHGTFHQFGLGDVYRDLVEPLLPVLLDLD
jgi:hypothetical protein